MSISEDIKVTDYPEIGPAFITIYDNMPPIKVKFNLRWWLKNLWQRIKNLCGVHR